MSECLYPTLVADGSLGTLAVDDCSTLHRQITSELEILARGSREACTR